MRKVSGSFILLLFLVIYIAAYVFFIAVIPPTLDDLRYSVESEQAIRKVEVTDIIKEKGKETLYKLDVQFCSSPVTIPESIYMEYIGDENNAITVTSETLAIFYGYKNLPEIRYETDFSKEKGNFKCIYIGATIFPWENADTYWNKERVLKEAEELIADKHRAVNNRTVVPENAKAFE